MRTSLTKRPWFQHPLLPVVLMLWALTPADLLALDPTRSLFQYNCRSWARQNGLPANGILAVTQSKDGYLWLGTSAGLARFDGIEFKLFDLGLIADVRSTIVTSLSSSGQGGLWFGLGRGAFGFCDGRNATLWGKEEWGGANLDVHSIHESAAGDLWVAAETGAARLIKGQRFENVLTHTMGTDRYDVMSIHEDSRGRIWLGTSRRGLYYWENGALHRFPDPAVDDQTVRCLVEDRQGQIWIGTDWGLLRYDANLQRRPFPFPWHPTRALLADRHGVLWIGTGGGGLVRYMNEGFTHFRKSDGLADDFVTALAEDEEGSLWLGTRNGLSQLSDVKIPTFGKNEGLTADVNVSVCASKKGGLWIATSDGVSFFDGSARPMGVDLGLTNRYVNGVFEARNGDLYLIPGSLEILVVSNGKTVARYPNKRWPTAIAEDSQSVIVAVGSELYRVTTNSFDRYVFQNNRTPPLNWIFHMTSGRDGSIWIAGDEGICRVKDGNFQFWGRLQGLADPKVLWVCEDADGVIWAGQETGITRLRDGQIRKIQRADGLLDSLIYAIVPDDQGFLWVDSSRGFFRVSRDGMNAFADGQTNRVAGVGFSGLDAVKSSEKYHQVPSGCRTLDGRIWFPTALGVVMIDPTHLAANPVPPRVHIDSVRADGRELPPTARAVVPSSSGELEFHYAGLSYIAPLRTRYRYRLEGYDSRWVEAGPRRAAFFTNLKPGQYQFHVQAGNEDGAWNPVAASFSIELQPRFYQTGWFTALAALAVSAGLFGIYRGRLGHLQRKQAELQAAHRLLEAKVRERTSELASSNASLKAEIEERRRMQSEVEQIHAQLIEASRHAGQAEVASSVLHSVGNVLNSVNVSTHLVSDRLRKLRQFADLSKAAELIQEHAGDLSRFLAEDERGRQLPGYFKKLAEHLASEQSELLEEVKLLADHVEHIKEIVAMQQSYARVSGVLEIATLSELVENALRMQSDLFNRSGIQVIREFANVPALRVDRHKVLRVLVNILQNAACACADAPRIDKTVSVRIRPGPVDSIQIEVTDNGVGIAPENLTRIFAHGFTTRKSGHGFGLHSAALAAKEMGGYLVAQSAGLGQGASFVLQIPVSPPTGS